MSFTLTLFFFASKEHVLASRAFAPPQINPLIYNDIKITASNSTPDDMGIVQAFNTKTNNLLWSKKIYKVRINPNVEEDTQLVFITEMKFEDDKLIVVNERQDQYIVDPYTGEVLSGNKTLYIIIVAAIIIIGSISLGLLYKNRRRPEDR